MDGQRGESDRLLKQSRRSLVKIDTSQKVNGIIGEKWTVRMGSPKRTVQSERLLSQSGRSLIEIKFDESGRYHGLEVEVPKVIKWIV